MEVEVADRVEGRPMEPKSGSGLTTALSYQHFLAKGNHLLDHGDVVCREVFDINVVVPWDNQVVVGSCWPDVWKHHKFIILMQDVIWLNSITDSAEDTLPSVGLLLSWCTHTAHAELRKPDAEVSWEEHQLTAVS